MQLSDVQRVIAPFQSPTHDAQALPLEKNPAVEDGTAQLEPVELEALALNLDASLRMHTRHQFFSWTQGTLQSLIEHQLLICALRHDGPAPFYVDSFSTAPVEAAHFNELFRRDSALVPQIIKTWEENRCQAVILESRDGEAYPGSALAHELVRMDSTKIVAHGTHDSDGRLASLFMFAGRAETTGPRKAYLAQLMVPSLHAAWVRTQVNWQPANSSAKPAMTSLLTSRELEILEWIYRGKSNIEIGMILKISPLTVKNHVQKILRKLTVVNRTQAVGKALALRILDT